MSFPVSQRQLKKENVLLEKACARDILPGGGQQDCRRAADGAVACSVTARRILCQRTEWQKSGCRRSPKEELSSAQDQCLYTFCDRGQRRPSYCILPTKCSACPSPSQSHTPHRESCLNLCAGSDRRQHADLGAHLGGTMAPQRHTGLWFRGEAWARETRFHTHERGRLAELCEVVPG